MTGEDTIVAIATPPGEGGIGIVRMSGPESESIIKKMFVKKNGNPLEEIRDRYFYYGRIVDRKGDTVDEVLMVMMRGPRSYTGEDIVEIHCHGGMVLLRMILKLSIEYGARLAEPGEFTKRAFLNGRIDLAQAEAVMDLISSSTEQAAKASARQLEGRLSAKIRDLRDRLLDILAHIEATIDYPEEDIDAINLDELYSGIFAIREDIQKLLDTAERGKLLRQGIKTVIIGKPNVGKSSLLNALVRENRAIVTDIPGTTRDIIEERINIRGVLVRIVDTAGIRETLDLVEKMGVERSKKNIVDADLVILVLDGSKPLEKDDEKIFELIKDKKVLVLINKTDLPMKIDRKRVADLASGKEILEISLLEERGIEEVEDYIYNLVFSGEIVQDNEVFITNIRHQEALMQSKKYLEDALVAIEQKIPIDLISIDIRSAWEALGSITGETVSEDIIDRIFSRFCVGK